MLLLGVGWAHAASVVITIDPENPAPNSQVKLTLVSYDMDVDTSLVIWKVKGKEVKRGLGVRDLTVTTGPSGSSFPVDASLTDSKGNSVITSITVAPQYVQLLWEAVESYVPAFYEGRALPAEGSVVKVTALPDIGQAPASLSYAWYVNDEYLSSSSGAGKQSAFIPLDTLSDSTSIKVRVRSALGGVAENTISLSPHPVMPLVYGYDDILGTLMAHAFGNRIELTNAITLSLEPYYLSTKRGLSSTAQYTWSLDGLPVTPQEQTILSLRPKENSYGVRNLSITTENTRRLLQQAEADMQIVFDTRK